MDKEFIIFAIGMLLITYACIGMYLYCIHQLCKGIDQKREEQRQQNIERIKKEMENNKIKIKRSF